MHLTAVSANDYLRLDSLPFTSLMYSILLSHQMTRLLHQTQHLIYIPGPYIEYIIGIPFLLERNDPGRSVYTRKDGFVSDEFTYSPFGLDSGEIEEFG